MPAFSPSRRAASLCLIPIFVACTDADGIAGTEQPTVRAPVASIQISIPQTAFRVRQVVAAKAVALDDSGKPIADAETHWFSDNTSVATVSSEGAITGTGPGTALITVTMDSFSKSFQVFVTKVPVGSIELSESSVTLNIGDRRQLTVVVKDSTGLVVTDRLTTWNSSEPFSVTVSPAGELAAVAQSTPVNVTATAEERVATVQVVVTGSPVNTAGHPLVFSSSVGLPFITQGNVTFTPAPDIMVARDDGSDLINLTAHRASDTDPSWSPDGGKIVFTSDRSGNADIYSIRSDGTGIARLTADSASDFDASWSPNGSRIIFASERGGDALPGSGVKTTGLFLMNPDGTGAVNVTRAPLTRDISPAWSPDGTRIAFLRIEYETTTSSSREKSRRIFIINSDGSGLRPFRPLDPNFIDDTPAWSPDGSQVAFSAFNVNHPAFFENWVVMIANADGTNLRLVTSVNATSRFPSFSPDGTRLVYSVSSDEFWARFSTGIAVINVDGSGGHIVLYDVTRRTLSTSPDAWR